MDDLEKILGEEPVIKPTVGFAKRVMREVHSEAAVPPPIEFPWHRLLPGVVTGVALMLATFVLLGWAAESGVELQIAERWSAWALTPTALGLTLAAAVIVGGGLLAFAVTRSGSRATVF